MTKCHECGGPILGDRTGALYCSTACRQRGWGVPRCSVCGDVIRWGRADAHYCSPACRQRAYRKRKTTTR